MGNLGNTDNIDVIAALKKAEKMRIEFVANVSHELRTPLTSIKDHSQKLKSSSCPHQ